MSELREILGETVTRLFSDLCTKDLLEKCDGGEWPAELWATVEENGLTRPLLPEDKGGVDAGWQAAYVILHAAGRYAAPIPLAETILAGWLLDQADGCTRRCSFYCAGFGKCGGQGRCHNRLSIERTMGEPRRSSCRRSTRGWWAVCLSCIESID